MKRIDTTPSTVLVLNRGEELLASLEALAEETGWKSAWLSGLGGAAKATLGFYDLESRQYQWKAFDQPLEIVSLTGNLSMQDGKPFWHVHGVFSGADYRAVSGHVKELVIGLTGELYITPLSAPLERTFDDTTGLRLL